MTFHDLVSVLNEWAAFIVAAGVIGALLWKLFKVGDYFLDIHKFLQVLIKQLTPNDGMSLDDTIRRLERNQVITHRNNERVWNLLLTFHKNDLDFNPRDYALEPIEQPPSKSRTDNWDEELDE